MQINRDLAREIKKACGIGDRATKLALLGKVRGVQSRMSQPDCAADPRKAMLEALKEYGRVPFALCLAATIYTTRQGWVSGRMMQWSQAILDLWTCKPYDIMQVAYSDSMHPTKVETYAGNFVLLTSEEVA